MWAAYVFRPPLFGVGFVSYEALILFENFSKNEIKKVILLDSHLLHLRKWQFPTSLFSFSDLCHTQREKEKSFFYKTVVDNSSVG